MTSMDTLFRRPTVRQPLRASGYKHAVKPALRPNSLEFYREAHGLRQADLAARVGRTRQTISQLERGVLDGSEELWEGLASAFAIEVSVLRRPREMRQ